LIKKINLFICVFILSISKLLANDGAVEIKGKFLDIIYPSVDLLYYDIVEQRFKYVNKAKVDTNSGDFTMKFNISSPVFCKFYEDFFYVTPGDSVRIEIATDTTVYKGYKLNITGHNASHYIFSDYLMTHSKINIDRLIKNYSGNWSLFKNECVTKYNVENKLLDVFSKEYKCSKDFYVYWRQEIFSKYLINLLQPLYQTKNADITPVKKFLEKMRIDSIFKVEKMYTHQSFRYFCSDYLKFIIRDQYASLSIYEELNETYHYVITHYSKRIKEYFVCFLFNRAILLKDKSAVDLVKEISTLSLNFFTDVDIKSHIKKSYLLFSNIARMLPDSILATKIYDREGRITELRDVLSSLKGKYILIDNWALWCTPCIAEIDKAYASLKVEELQEKELQVLYLSQDENFYKWTEFIKKKKFLSQNNFMLMNMPNSFINFFMIHTIPRYILLGRDGDLIDYDAPRLSDHDSIFRLIKE